ncbi:MAG: symmetrical bis(5'-nucleosyl)-tetraphosphatase [Pseudomonadota bacterium]
MSIYAIGDIQACYDELQQLLNRIDFNPASDQLWLVGDLVDRGPKSLETLRFVKSLGDAAITVLGNHDLHLLASHAGVRRPSVGSSLHAVLNAPDCDDLIHWLRQRPLLHHDPDLNLTMVHAGLPPQWNFYQARGLAKELETTLRSDSYQQFLWHMYGNEPAIWSDELQGWDRLRAITNGLTRLRYCKPDGSMDMKVYTPPGTQAKGLIPWFQAPGRKNAGINIIFGHWAALGFRREPKLIALDSGCVWGGKLTAIRLDRENQDVIAVDCPCYSKP